MYRLGVDKSPALDTPGRSDGPRLMLLCRGESITHRFEVEVAPTLPSSPEDSRSPSRIFNHFGRTGTISKAQR